MRWIAVILSLALAVPAPAAVTNLSTDLDWQAVIQGFSGANTAIVAAGTYAVTNTLFVPANTLITGTWDRAAAFTGGGTCRVIQAQGAGVRLVGLTVRNGYVPAGSPAGAGIKGFGDGANRISVSNCAVLSNWYGGNVSFNWGAGMFYGNAFNSEISWNVATNAWGGGAGYSTLSNCVLRGNEALAGGGGAGILAFGCTFSGNKAHGVGGGQGGAAKGGFGGYLEDCTIVSNLAFGGGGGTYDMSGRRNLYAYNVATNSNAGGVYGGAHSNIVVEFNAARGGNRDGGGVRSATLYDSIVRSNSASHNNGGIDLTTAYRTLIQNNLAGNTGGVGGPSALYGCVVDGNTVTAAGAVIYVTAMHGCTVVNIADGRWAVAEAATAAGSIWNNVFWNPQAATNWYRISTNAGNNVTNDPVFVAGTYMPTAPYVLDAGGGAYGSGPLDFYGYPRTNGLAVDAGAAELDVRPVLVPHGDWAVMFRAFASKFVDSRTSTVSGLSVDLSYFPTSDTGLDSGDLWRDGDVIKVKE